MNNIKIKSIVRVLALFYPDEKRNTPCIVNCPKELVKDIRVSLFNRFGKREIELIKGSEFEVKVFENNLIEIDFKINVDKMNIKIYHLKELV